MCRWHLTLMLLLSLGSCRPGERERAEEDRGAREEADDGRLTIGFGVIAGSDPGRTHRRYQPLMDYLSRETPFAFRIRLGQTSEDLLVYVEERMAEIVPLRIIDYLDAHRKFGAVPLVKRRNRQGEPVSRSVFLTRGPQPPGPAPPDAIGGLGALAGRSLALGPAHSTLSHLVPRLELIRAGVRLADLGVVEHLLSAEAAASAVLEGRFDAGAVGDAVARRYDLEGLRAFHQSPPIPSAPLVVRDDLPDRVVQPVRDALVRLEPGNAPARKDWAEAIRYGFAPAGDADYTPVRRMVAKVSGTCAQDCHSRIAFDDGDAALP